jgi:hypothetical protein
LWATNRHTHASYLLDRTRYDLLLPGSSSKLKGGGAIVISCVASADISTTIVEPTASSSVGHPLTVPSANVALSKPEDDQALLESFVHSIAENLHMSTPSGIGTAGTVMECVSSATSPDSFATVIGFLEKFVQIGDTVAEVSQL